MVRGLDYIDTVSSALPHSSTNNGIGTQATPNSVAKSKLSWMSGCLHGLGTAIVKALSQQHTATSIDVHQSSDTVLDLRAHVKGVFSRCLHILRSLIALAQQQPAIRQQHHPPTATTAAIESIASLLTSMTSQLTKLTHTNDASATRKRNVHRTTRTFPTLLHLIHTGLIRELLSHSAQLLQIQLRSPHLDITDADQQRHQKIAAVSARYILPILRSSLQPFGTQDTGPENAYTANAKMKFQALLWSTVLGDDANAAVDVEDDCPRCVGMGPHWANLTTWLTSVSQPPQLRFSV